MKVKTNIRAGQGGSTSVDSTSTSVDTSTSTSNAAKNQNGKYKVVYYSSSRCVGI